MFSMLNLLAKIWVLLGFVVGVFVWSGLNLAQPHLPKNVDIASLTGAATALGLDFVYRVFAGRERAWVRLFHSDCGGAYLGIPVWALALLPLSILILDRLR